MAAKSDFAQKLLHDLRLRKERMGASQSSSHTNGMTRDTYRNPGNVQRGSRQTKTLESIGGPNTVNHRPMTFGGSGRALSIKESSQQIVSYGSGRHGRSESIGDLPMAFTYAVKNGGKLVNMDFSGSSYTNTMIDFLHQIGRRSLDGGNMRNGTSLVKHRPLNGAVRAPALTNIQIKEISKGVQNLYEILRSSSNGMNVDRYSMEVGKELLKGARGLEESLRMLVNLQEASEMMVSPQRKSRITLLEVDDQDDEGDSLKIVDQNQVALPRFSFDKPSKKSRLALTNVSSKLSTHQRSASYGADSLRGSSTASEAKNSSSRSEKGRISNVIAKLMGLEEVPGKLDMLSMRNESKNAEQRIGLAEKQVNKMTRPEKDALVPLNDRKSRQIQDSDTQAVPGPHRTRVNIDTQQINIERSDQLHEKQERRPNGETKEKIQQKRRSPEVAANPRQERVQKKKTIRMEKSNEIRLISRNSKTQEPEKRTQKSKQDSQQIKQNHNQVKSKDLPSKEIQPSEENLKAKDATPKAQESEPERTEGIVQPPLVKKKPVTRKKADSMAVHRTEAPRKKDEVLKRRNGTPNNLGRPSKHKLPVLQETKRKNVQQLGSISSKQEETGSKVRNLKKSESTTPLDDSTTNVFSRIPICKDDIKDDSKENSEVVVVGKYAGPNERSMETCNLSANKPKKAFNSGIQVVLTEQEKQLKEILIKDQLFLSTAEALFKLNIPVGFLHADDHNHHGDETKLKLDCGYEILKRKARSEELSVHPYMKPSVAGTTIRFLDDLVKQLYKDLENLRLYGRNARNEYDEADYMHHMLERDIHNKNPDINSFWDFGWHVTTFAFVEKDEFTKDVEQDVLHILVDEIIDDLLGMALPFSSKKKAKKIAD